MFFVYFSTKRIILIQIRQYRWNFAELFLALASTKLHIFLLLLKHFGCYDSFNFPLTYSGANE